MCQVLAFIIRGAPREQGAAVYAWFERWCFPELEWFRRLHIVMAVNKEMRTGNAVAIATRGSGDHDRVTRSGAQAAFQADLTAMCYQPFRTSSQVRLVLRLRRNAGEANVLAKF